MQFHSNFRKNYMCQVIEALKLTKIDDYEIKKSYRFPSEDHFSLWLGEKYDQYQISAFMQCDIDITMCLIDRAKAEGLYDPNADIDNFYLGMKWPPTYKIAKN